MIEDFGAIAQVVGFPWAGKSSGSEKMCSRLGSLLTAFMRRDMNRLGANCGTCRRVLIRPVTTHQKPISSPNEILAKQSRFALGSPALMSSRHSSPEHHSKSIRQQKRVPLMGRDGQRPSKKKPTKQDPTRLASSIAGQATDGNAGMCPEMQKTSATGSTEVLP
jgi:hypothetical protein